MDLAASVQAVTEEVVLRLSGRFHAENRWQLFKFGQKSAIPYDKAVYRQRNLIEGIFGRLNDFRRVPARYDKLIQNYLANVLRAATVIWWLNRVRTLTQGSLSIRS